MIVYQLDAAGYYLGEAVADESPLEPGVWLIPAGCVETPPPAIPEGQRARWEAGEAGENGEAGGAWILEAIPEPEPEPDTTEPEPMDRSRILTRVEFIRRLSPQEWATAKTSSLPEVMYFTDLVLAAAEIDLDDAQTQAGLAVAVQAGVLTSERAAQVLA
ncbi:hypothetical protein [Megalodesulfovibrio paquesii]